MNSKQLLVVLTCGAAMALPLAAQAADSDFFSVTLFGGYVAGDNFEDTTTQQSVKLDSSSAYGLTFNMEAEEDSYYEFTYQKQNAKLGSPAGFDVSMEYIHIGGNVEFARENARVIPYFSLTLGATRFSPDLSGLNSASKFSLGVGAGLKIPLAKHVGLRLDLHGYGTFMNGDTSVFCELPTSSSGCEITVHGDTLIQGEGTLGVTVGF